MSSRRRPRFASRTEWDLTPNRLAALAHQRRSAGLEILNLTESNPTRCGFQYGEPARLEAAEYDPQPRGLLAARAAVARYYSDWNAPAGPEHILLTSGSSEAYSCLFRLLAEPGDNVLAPVPSYPLFEFLARLNDLELRSYRLEYHQRWELEEGALETAANERTRAVIVVNPNNPTGSLVAAGERARLVEFCARRGLALIADEVFLDYSFAGGARSLAGETGCLTFALNGLSKTAALPQMKLGWIAASGPGAEEALARLEVIADTYLSVGTAVQHALPGLLAGRGAIQRQIRERTAANLRTLDELLARQTLAGRLEVEGGWSVVLRLPRTRTDEEWAVELLDRDGVLVHPGHFFDFPAEGCLVLSLLPRPEVFRQGAERLLARAERTALA